MHIDVNNAFLSWSAVDLLNKGYKYDIRNSYAVIGGDESIRHGIVLAKSMPAKRLGIVTAEPLISAKKKCPALRVYPPNFEFYKKMSDSMFNILYKYTPDIEIASIDECYLDYGKVKKLYGDELEFAKKVQKEIYDTLGFTVNVGIANNKLCAKMASDFLKPNKIHTLYDYEVQEKMYKLDISDLYGIGKKTVPKLRALNINTIGDLANFDLNELTKYFKNQAINMINSAKGINNDEVINYFVEPKGIGNEITLDRDVANKNIIYDYLKQLSDKVARRLRKQNKYAYVIVVVIKDNMFRRKSHQVKLNNATNVSSEIYETAKKVFEEMYDNELIRLIGVRVDNLVDNNIYQISIFENDDNRKNDEVIEKLLDDLKDKYGNRVIDRASLK